MTTYSFDIDKQFWAELTDSIHAKKGNPADDEVREFARNDDCPAEGTQPSRASAIELSSGHPYVVHDASSFCSWHTVTATSGDGVPVTVTRMASTGGRFCVDLARRLTTPVALYVALPCLKSRAIIWGGGSTQRSWLHAGDCIIYGPTPSLRLTLLAPFDLLHFAIPRLGGALTSTLSAEPGVQHTVASSAYQVSDPVIGGIAQLMAAEVHGTERGASPHVRHLVSALLAHLDARYTSEPPSLERPRRGLTAWQERRAIEMLTRGVGDTPNIDAIAQTCGLSPDRFIRLFKLTTGMPPHRWLRRYRVEFAKKRLSDNSLALSEIALSCGFSDQSHFTRVFSAWTGVTPGEWRRRNLADYQPKP